MPITTQKVREATLRYFEIRRHGPGATSEDMFPTTAQIYYSEPLRELRREDHIACARTLTTVLEQLIQEGAVTRCSDKFKGVSGAPQRADQFYYNRDP